MAAVNALPPVGGVEPLPLPVPPPGTPTKASAPKSGVRSGAPKAKVAREVLTGPEGFLLLRKELSAIAPTFSPNPSTRDQLDNTRRMLYKYEAWAKKLVPSLKFETFLAETEKIAAHVDLDALLGVEAVVKRKQKRPAAEISESEARRRMQAEDEAEQRPSAAVSAAVEEAWDDDDGLVSSRKKRFRPRMPRGEDEDEDYGDDADAQRSPPAQHAAAPAGSPGADTEPN
eukprot:m51a1_g475 hypothetical protein (229) ;mRNA; f:196663-197657